MAEVLRTDFVCFAYWEGGNVVLLTDDSGNLLTDGDGHYLYADQQADSGLALATRDWLTDKRFYNGTLHTDTDYWVSGDMIRSAAIAMGGALETTIHQHSTQIVVIDADLAITTESLINETVIVEHLAVDYLDDGTTQERIRRRGYVCVSWVRDKHTLTINLEDLTDELLSTTYPALQYKKDSTYMPGLLTEDVSTVIPYVVGRGTKVKCIFIKDREILTEQVIDGDFDLGTSANWHLANTVLWTVSSGKARKTAGESANLSQAITTVKGSEYVISFDYEVTAGTLGVGLHNVICNQSFTATSGEVKEAIILKPSTTAKVSDLGIFFRAESGFAGTIDNVLVKLLKNVRGVGNTIADHEFTWGVPASPWATGSGWSIDDLRGVAIKVPGYSGTLSQTPNYASTTSHVLSVYMSVKVLAGSFTVKAGNVTHRRTITATGTYRLNMIPVSSGQDLIITPSTDAHLEFYYVSMFIKEMTGSDLVSTGGFSSTGTWSLGGSQYWNEITSTETAGVCFKYPGSSHILSPSPAGTPFAPTVNTHYQVGMDYTCDAGFLIMTFGGQTYYGDRSVKGRLQAKSGSVTWYVTATTTANLEIIPSVFFLGSVDNVSIKEATPYIYSICQANLPTTLTVSSVYKGNNFSGVIVPTAQYRQDTYTASDCTLHVLKFDTDQVDFSGNRSQIYADVVHGTANVNVVTEIARLLTYCGLTVNTTSQAAAEAIATTNEMFVNWAYGYDGQAKTVRSYLDQFILILRGAIYTDLNNQWCFWQDVAGSSVATYGESLGDLIDVGQYGQARAPARINLGYRPNPQSPDQPYHILTRSIAGGVSGEVNYEVPAVYDFASADRLVDYLANRLAYNRYCNIMLPKSNVTLGNIITVGHVLQWQDDRNWIIIELNTDSDVDNLNLVEYSTDVYTYTAGVAPEDGTGYMPDYSNTLPSAPTALTIRESRYDDLADRSLIVCECTPPTVNYNAIWFEIERTDDNTLRQVIGKQSGSIYEATIDGLSPGKQYSLSTYAINKFGLTGTYSSAVDFTATPRQKNDLPVVTGLNLLNDDSPAINPMSGDYQQLLVEWDDTLDEDVAGYSIEWRFDTADYTLFANVVGSAASKWINADTYKTQTLSLRARTYDKTRTQYSEYCSAITYVIPDPSP